jgi:hypothetical protein
MSHRAVIVLGLAMLTACSTESEVLKVSAQLTCQKMIKCHLIEWSVGLRYGGPNLSGSHITCQCIDGA